MVELKNQLDAPLGQLAATLGRATTPTPQNVRGRCSSPLRDLPAEGVADLLGQAAKVRLEAKATALAAVAARATWEQTLWEGLFTALGYKQNSWPMRRLAELLQELRRGLGRAPEPVVLLARLLGVGGLLPGQLDRDKLTNRHLRTLWDQWWRDRDRLAKRILPNSVWIFHGLRPANRPERRLALAAHWLAKAPEREAMISKIYLTALGREPTPTERNIARDMVGEKPNIEGTLDLLWVVVMLPEFQLIH